VARRVGASAIDDDVVGTAADANDDDETEDDDDDSVVKGRSFCASLTARSYHCQAEP
jgi:hypothetical protein